MYFPYFIAYITIGFVISFVVLIWALKNGQFKDQQRARFLPLEELPSERPAAVSRIKRIEIYALGFLAAAGLLTSAAVLVFSLLRG